MNKRLMVRYDSKIKSFGGFLFMGLTKHLLGIDNNLID